MNKMIANFGLWLQTEDKFVVLMTVIGTLVVALALYALMMWVIPAVVTTAVKRIRRTFVRRIDRFFYLIRKNHGRKTTSRQYGEERVIQTLNGNLNDSH